MSESVVSESEQASASDPAERDERGRFGAGNHAAVGRGRPRRSTELDYLAALGDEISLDNWRLICRRALADSLNGDAKAREWISRYALGTGEASLMALATREACGISVADELAAHAELVRRRANGEYMYDSEPTPIELIQQQRLQAEREQREAADREVDRLRREARKLARAQAGTAQNSEIPAG